MEGCWLDHRQRAMRGAEGGVWVSPPLRGSWAALGARKDSDSNWCHTLLRGGGTTGQKKEKGESRRGVGKELL